MLSVSFLFFFSSLSLSLSLFVSVCRLLVRLRLSDASIVALTLRPGVVVGFDDITTFTTFDTTTTTTFTTTTPQHHHHYNNRLSMASADGRLPPGVPAQSSDDDAGGEVHEQEQEEVVRRRRRRGREREREREREEVTKSSESASEWTAGSGESSDSSDDLMEEYYSDVDNWEKRGAGSSSRRGAGGRSRSGSSASVALSAAAASTSAATGAAAATTTSSRRSGVFTAAEAAALLSGPWLQDRCDNPMLYFVGAGAKGSYCLSSISGGYSYYFRDGRNNARRVGVVMACRFTGRGPQPPPPSKPSDRRCSRHVRSLGQEPKEHRPWHEPDVVESWAAMGRRALLELWAAICRARLEDAAAAAAESGDGGVSAVEGGVEEQRHPWPEHDVMVDHVLAQMEVEPWAVDSLTGFRLSDYPGSPLADVRLRLISFVNKYFNSPDSTTTRQRLVGFLREIEWAVRVLNRLRQDPDEMVSTVYSELEEEDAAGSYQRMCWTGDVNERGPRVSAAAVAAAASSSASASASRRRRSRNKQGRSTTTTTTTTRQRNRRDTDGEEDEVEEVEEEEEEEEKEEEDEEEDDDDDGDGEDEEHQEQQHQQQQQNTSRRSSTATGKTIVRKSSKTGGRSGNGL